MHGRQTVMVAMIIYSFNHQYRQDKLFQGVQSLGTKVFETNIIGSGWDGNFLAGPAHGRVYLTRSHWNWRPHLQEFRKAV
jgi:hypothetical protein